MESIWFVLVSLWRWLFGWSTLSSPRTIKHAPHNDELCEAAVIPVSLNVIASASKLEKQYPVTMVEAHVQPRVDNNNQGDTEVKDDLIAYIDGYLDYLGSMDTPSDATKGSNNSKSVQPTSEPHEDNQMLVDLQV
ncbi:hypothetical protein LEN26_005773 [Aphanomyces euteiches]|nr:hypothetical protein LEN26_005773 [Aphanomyces euteiches]